MRYIGLVALLALSSTVALAQSITGVSGDYDEGGAVIITGLGFGTKSPVAPMVYETFDSGVDMQPVRQHLPYIGTSGSGDLSDPADDPARFSLENTRDGTLAARFTYPDSLGGGVLEHLYFPFSDSLSLGDRGFASVHISSDYAGSCVPEGSQQWKIWHPFAHGHASGNYYPCLVNNWNCRGDFPGGLLVQQYSDEGANNAGEFSVFTSGIGNVPEIDQWWQYEIEHLVNSAVGASDGAARVWYSGDLRGDEEDWETIQSTLVDGYAYGVTNIGMWIGIIVGGPYHMRFDDLYVDNTWARVALGNASTWANCTVREYQPPTEWSDTEVTVTANVGAFSEGQTVWLYLVTEDGARSGGYAVQIGSDVGVSQVSVQSATRSGTNAALTWTSGDGGPYTAWLAESGVELQSIATSDTTATIPIGTGAIDVTVQDGTTVSRANIAEAE